MANFFKNTFTKSKYLTIIVIFIVNNKMISSLWIRYIVFRLKKVIYTTNVLILSSIAILANFFVLIISTY